MELAASRDSITSTDSTSTERKWEELISSDTLQMISKASGGFTFIEDPNAPTAYTDMETRVIHMPSFMIRGDAKRGIKPVENLEAIFYHEAGHHSPDVIPLQNKMRDQMTKMEVPESYQGDSESEKRFITAVWQNVGNVAADIWLEALMSRAPYFGIRSSINKLYGEFVKPDEQYKAMNRVDQWVQALLETRYNPDRDFSKILHPDVVEEFNLITKRPKTNLYSPMEILRNARPFESFPTPAAKDKAIEDKFRVYSEYMIPSFLKLLEKELEERKQNAQAAKDQKGKGLLDKLKGKGSGGSGSSVPLTKKEMDDLIKEIIEELEKSGQNHTQAPSKEEKDADANAKRTLDINIKNRKENKNNPDASSDKGPNGMEKIADLGDMLKKQMNEDRQRGLAEGMKVRQESIKTWEKIKLDYNDEIDTLAASLAEIFLEDRRAKRDMLYRDGMMIEGLEYETVTAIMSGEIDPQTNYRIIKNPKFLETEIEFIMDTSGSMHGETAEKSVALEVITTEAFKRVQEILEGEGLVSEEEKPFRIGLTTFDVNPKRITTLAEPISDEKELKMIEYSSEIGGGTSETESVKNVYEELTLHEDHIIKIIVLLTDGHGDKYGVAPVMRQIEKDDEVIFVATGLGSNATGVIESYLKPLKNKNNANIIGLEAQNPSDIIPLVTDFLRKEVLKRRT